MVTHPFVLELADGTLPAEKFKAYFVQDYIFVEDLVAVTALGISKAPDFASASRLNQFLAGILSPENDLFVRAFKRLAVSEEEYAAAEPSPTTQAFGDFLRRVGLYGGFEEILMALYVTEGTYLDWASRVIEAGNMPTNSLYREWIEIHGPHVLGDLVGWVRADLDKADLGPRRTSIEKIFVTALRYEYLFWEAAYSGERWPDR